MVRRIALPLSIVLVAVAVRAEDWPQFRGPSGQGHSAERGVPFEWSETRNIIWKTPVPGSGWSSPVVAGGRVPTGNKAEIVLAYARLRYLVYGRGRRKTGPPGTLADSRRLLSGPLTGRPLD